jgi:hypothetical protein
MSENNKNKILTHSQERKLRRERKQQQQLRREQKQQPPPTQQQPPPTQQLPPTQQQQNKRRNSQDRNQQQKQTTKTFKKRRCPLKYQKGMVEDLEALEVKEERIKERENVVNKIKDFKEQKKLEIEKQEDLKKFFLENQKNLKQKFDEDNINLVNCIEELNNNIFEGEGDLVKNHSNIDDVNENDILKLDMEFRNVCRTMNAEGRGYLIDEFYHSYVDRFPETYKECTGLEQSMDVDSPPSSSVEFEPEESLEATDLEGVAKEQCVEATEDEEQFLEVIEEQSLEQSLEAVEQSLEAVEEKSLTKEESPEVNQSPNGDDVLMVDAKEQNDGERKNELDELNTRHPNAVEGSTVDLIKQAEFEDGLGRLTSVHLKYLIRLNGLTIKNNPKKGILTQFLIDNCKYQDFKWGDVGHL